MWHGPCVCAGGGGESNLGGEVGKWQKPVGVKGERWALSREQWQQGCSLHLMSKHEKTNLLYAKLAMF